jgi:hypothetical protein
MPLEHMDDCLAAAECGDLAVLQWARDQEPPCPCDVEECLDEATDAATAEWIRAQAPPFLARSALHSRHCRRPPCPTPSLPW